MTWTARGNLGVSRGWIGGRIAYANSKYYFAGGVTSGWGDGEYHARSNRTDEYDPITGTWTQKAGMPYYISCGALSSNGSYVFHVGGLVRNSSSTSYPTTYGQWVYYYDPTINSWNSFNYTALYAYGIHHNSLSQVGGVLYTFNVCGFQPQKITINWTLMRTTPVDLAATGFDFVGEWFDTAQVIAAPSNEASPNIYVIKAGDNRHLRYNIADDSVTLAAPVPSGMEGSSVAPPTYTRIGDQLHLFGGSDAGADYTQWVQQWIYDPVSDSWTRSEDAPVGFAAHAAALLVDQGTMLVAGGQGNPVSSGYKNSTYEAARPPIDLPTMSIVGESDVSFFANAIVNMIGEGVVEIEPEKEFVSTPAPGIRIAAMPV